MRVLLTNDDGIHAPGLGVLEKIALSQCYGLTTRQNPHWDTALRHGPALIRRVLAEGMPRDVLVNVNFPDCAADAVKGIAVTTQGKRDQELLRIEPRFDGRGNP